MVVGSEVKKAAQGAVAMIEMEQYEGYRCRKRIRRNREEKGEEM